MLHRSFCDWLVFAVLVLLYLRPWIAPTAPRLAFEILLAIVLFLLLCCLLGALGLVR